MWIVLVTSALTLVSYYRWLRVAQREHYEPTRLFAIEWIWIKARPVEAILLGAVVVVCLASFVLPYGALVGALLFLGWPVGMSFTGAKRLVWTDRVKRLAGVLFVLHAVVTVLIALLAPVAAGLLPILAVPLAEAALAIMWPIEKAMAKKWQVQAAATIKKVNPKIVAITGSYGKTSTKNYATHLMQGRWSTLASPASFNNAMGLSRAVNDRLQPGTDIFVAEMGTYGPGEIAELTEIFPPEVAAITTIGEAHLERMKSRETIVKAKSEILPKASTVVLNIDVPELALIAENLRASKRVIACSAVPGTAAEVLVTDGKLTINNETYAVELPDEVGHPINVAIAVGLALAVEVPIETITQRLASIPGTPHRAEANRTPGGVWVIDDTFNSNPTGAAAALAKAKRLAGESGTVWTITPGMVELGTEQAARNIEFAQAATASDKMQLCIVGRTNRKALRAGDPARTTAFDSRKAAADHALTAAKEGDVVLYENDLPDHYA
ncbi:Mur ligase family protein [Nocardioides sp. WG-D5]|uniref:UDP-N-acetylmuramoyl-tripeptide--D-alanyl-D- alanine ligase n=1 Tax=Nocardioides luteus TaxID=1844 RepID=UPI0002028333|nr:UDP-N-acetylmuramoyl-tripeptide--D-alanyl-D-alanine ligase [Nocardioides luteus]EGD43527.1 putative UDP-N-acetylmuramoylalanyl-D-glutamyl-2, 6-diaminopimelate--D-alanyl-D-alanyl ligase [Nocardioidaceae bacterium Broad-1]MBG6097596.1 UDP-N-acetylmuramoyl-tripeptide--D-alanyl-D-alanine ligase [Nocardioides luteus]